MTHPGLDVPLRRASRSRCTSPSPGSRRVRDTQGFYVAGRGVPAIANGMATAADWMSAASFISMAGLISIMGYAGGIYLMGWTGGYVLLALLLAPYLRKFGHFTVPDFVGDRYESQRGPAGRGDLRDLRQLHLRRRADARRGHRVQPLSRGRHHGRRGDRHGHRLRLRHARRHEGHHLDPGGAVLGADHRLPDPRHRHQHQADRQRRCRSSAWARTLLGERRARCSTSSTRSTPISASPATPTPFVGSWDKLNVFCVTLALMVGTAGLPHVIVRFYTVQDVRAARWSALLGAALHLRCCT